MTFDNVSNILKYQLSLYHHVLIKKMFSLALTTIIHCYTVVAENYLKMGQMFSFKPKSPQLKENMVIREIRYLII